jgi:ATP-dependent RNA helicase RhlE
MLVVSQTGSGKTLMFLLPLLQQLGGAGSAGSAARGATQLQPQGLVLLPTPDLAVQVAAVAAQLAASLPSPLTIQLLTGRGELSLPAASGTTVVAVATTDILTGNCSRLRHVCMYDLPQDVTAFIHCVGATLIH